MKTPLPTLESELNLLHARICPALSDPKRMLLLYLTAERERSVSDLTEVTGMPQSTVSRHLAVLRERALVTTRRQGTSIYYKVKDPRLIQAMDSLRDVLNQVLQEQSDTSKEILNTTLKRR